MHLKMDRRLLGTWKSDRARTFRHFRPKPNCPPASLRKLKAMFGKLTVRWGRRKCYTDLDGYRDVSNYEVIARDSVSVVVRLPDFLSGEPRLHHIHFDGEYYWIPLSGGLCEFFRRVSE